jgi:hypothetical protein
MTEKISSQKRIMQKEDQNQFSKCLHRFSNSHALRCGGVIMLAGVPDRDRTGGLDDFDFDGVSWCLIIAMPEIIQMKTA